MIETLKAKLQELNNLSQTLNGQLEQLRQQFDENRPVSFSPFLSSSSDSVVSDMSDDLREVSMDMDSSLSNDTLGNSLDGDSINNDRDDGNEAGDVVQQVERTVVSSLFDLSSHLERIRNQMRSVLDGGVMEEGNSLNDVVQIPSDALNAIVNNNQSSSSIPGPSNNTSSISRESVDVDSADINSVTNSDVDEINDTERREDIQGEINDSGLPMASEYSPASFHSNSVVSEREHASSADDTFPVLGHQNSDVPGRNFTERARNTQNWVESLIQSPVHIIESQPPRSPSDSESSFSSIPSMSSTESIRSRRNSDVDHITSTPNVNRDDGDNEAESTHDTDSRSSFCSLLSYRSSQSNKSLHSYKSSHGERSADETSEKYDNCEDSLDIHVSGPAETTSSLGSGSPHRSSINGQSDHESNSSHSSKSVHRYSKTNNSREEHYLSFDSDNTARDNRLSENQEPCSKNSYAGYSLDNNDDYNDTAKSPSKGNGLSTQGSFLYDSDSDDSQNMSAASQHTNAQPVQSDIDESDNSNDNLPQCPVDQTPDRTTTNQLLDSDIPVYSDTDYVADLRVIQENNSPSNYKIEHDPTAKLSESRTDTTVNETSSSSVVSSDCSDPSDQENSRRTWKYETNQPAQRYNTTVNKFATKVQAERELDTAVEIDRDNSETSIQNDVLNKPFVWRKSTEQNQNYPDNKSSAEGNKGSSMINYGNKKETSRQIAENSRQIADNRKRKADKLHETNDNIKRSRHLKTTYSSHSPGYSSQQVRQSSPRADSSQSTRRPRSSSTVQSSSSKHDNTAQSLNVKIDLSLINYSGNILAQPVSKSIPTSGPTVIHSTASVSPKHHTVAATARQTRPSSQRANNASLPTSNRQHSNNSQRRVREARCTIVSGQNNETHHSDSHREFPFSWRDDSDSESDETWEPEGEDHETDVTLSEEGESEGDTDYEVEIPKSTADLLQEYASDETDESWTYGMESLD